MRIPLSYNLRNLAVRKTTTALTAGGIALTVAVLMSVMALNEGLRRSLEASGHPLHLLVMRKGATSELTSILGREPLQIVKTQPGIAATKAGEPMASLELVTGISLGTPGQLQVSDITLRGLLPIGFAMRERLRLTEGRVFEPGKREVVAGKSIAGRYPAARVGGTIRFGRGEWAVVGIADSGEAAGSHEILGDLNQIAAEYNRNQALSSILVRAAGESELLALQRNLEADRRITVQAQREIDYYNSQMVSAAPLRFMGLLVAVMLAIGSSVAAMNTMYAAVARRSAEIGTLRVLGFSRGSVMVSFLIESLLLSLLGAAIGCAMVLPLNRIGTSISSLVTFTEFAFKFRVTPEIIVTGIVFGLVMGALGGLLPAWNAARKEVLAALRA